MILIEKHNGDVVSTEQRSISDVLGRPKYRCHFGPLIVMRENITSLDGVPELIGGDFHIEHNFLTSLKGIHNEVLHICDTFSAVGNPLKSHVLGLLLIKGLRKIYIDNKQVQDILNRHLHKGRSGLLIAQEELIEAGLEEFAQL